MCDLRKYRLLALFLCILIIIETIPPIPPAFAGHTGSADMDGGFEIGDVFPEDDPGEEEGQSRAL